MEVLPSAEHEPGTEEELLPPPDPEVTGEERVSVTVDTPPPLRGIVVDDLDQPLAGALVSMERSNGQKPVEVVSGSDGTFLVAETRDLRGAPRADLDGYVLFKSDRLDEIEQGGWQSPRVVMTRHATLIVQVCGSDGEPGEGAYLRLGIAGSEKTDQNREVAWADSRNRDGGEVRVPGWPQESRTCRAGENGLVLFEDAWSGRRIEVIRGRRGRRGYSAVHDGFLVSTDHPGAKPLVLAPGERRTLVLRVAEEQPLYVEGRVLKPDGELIPLATVEVQRLALDGRTAGRAGAYVEGDGRFECRVPRVVPGELLRITAFDGHGDSESSRYAGVVIADSLDAQEGRLVVDVICEAALALAGCVLGCEGEPIGGWLHVELEGTRDPHDLAHAFSGGLVTLREGRFRVGGLGPGYYTVRVSERRSGLESVTVFPHIPAGQEDLELCIGAAADVIIRISADTDGVQVSKSLAFLFCDGSLEEAPGAGDSRRELVDLTSWPPNIRFHTGYSCSTVLTWKGATEIAHEWPAVRPGRYYVGIEAWDVDGMPLYPMASEPVALGSGRHEFVTRLRRGATLTGRVKGNFDPGTMGVALADDEGRLLPLFPDGKQPTQVVVCQGQGRFHVDLALTGEFTLLVGTESAIRAGRPLVQKPVTVGAGKNEPLEIDLR